MEFCDGGDVEEALRAHPRPPARVVVWLLRQMARALLFAKVFLSLCLSLFLSLSFSLSRSLSLARARTLSLFHPPLMCA